MIGWENLLERLIFEKKHKVNVIGIKEGGKVRLTISPDTVLEAGETMLVLGNNKDLQKCFHI